MTQNIERERKNKQEFQDFVMKKELKQNALNTEVSLISENMIRKQKLKSQFVERDIVNDSVPFRELKKIKPEKILTEVRNKKLAEFAIYKNKTADKKLGDITSLLQMMQDVGMKVPAFGKDKEK